MESQVLSVLPKPDSKEKILHSSSPVASLLEETKVKNEPMEIQNISVGEVTDLMAQEESLSFVVMGEGGVEWIDNTVVLESENVVRPQETEQMIVVDTSSDCLSSIEEELVKRDRSDTRKRGFSGSLFGQPICKVIKMPPRDKVFIKADHETKPCYAGHPKTLSYQTVPDGNTTFVSSVSDKSDKTLYQAKDIPAKTTFPPKPHKIMVVKQDSSLIRVYESSDSSSSSEGSISHVSFKKEPSCSDATASEHQQITVVTTPTVVKVSDSMPKREVFTSAESARDNQSVRISSPVSNVELVLSKDHTLRSKTRKSWAEPQTIIRVTGENISTGVVEGGVVYRCGECDYASANKHYYKQHVDLVHNTARPFKCPFCDYAGKRGHALREHLVVHSAERPYSCLHCNATFRKKGHLTNHTKLHATSAGTLCATSLPGGLLGGANTIKIGSSSMGSFVKIPVEGNGPIITVKAEPSGCETTIVTPSHQTSLPGGAGIPRKSNNLWCALCDKEMADAGFFQAHLKNVHGTDRLFACERCDYVTANRGAIFGHLAKHIPPTSTTADTQPSAVVPPPSNPPPPPPPTLAPTPLYGCTHCGYTTPDMSAFVSHATCHNVAVTASAAPVTSKVLPKPSQPQQISKAICSECGHVADSPKSMLAHLWTHIGATPLAENPRPPAQQDQKMAAESAVPQMVEQSNIPCPVGLKTLPENAAFKCTECSYVSRDASQFVKHMLVHKTQQNQAPRIQVQSSSSSPAPALSASAIKPSANSYKVKPITTENTCQNAESSPFVHDPARGRFRCTICGYSCEYQRTIKAHIWKHSGHQQVDYPIFQNGPLSMYEDTAPSTQPAIPPGKPSTAAQPLSTTAPVHTNTVHLAAATAQPLSSISDTVRTTPSVSALPVNSTTSGSAVITSSGSVPVSVKFITVSGSQVLHSSAPLPPGSVKLIPMQPTPATKPSPLPVADGSKHVIVHVQGAQSEGPIPVLKKITASSVPTFSIPASVSSVPVKSSEPLQQKVTPLPKREAESEGDTVKSAGREEDKEFKPLSDDAPVTTPASNKEANLTESRSVASTVDREGKTDIASAAVTSRAESAEGTTGASQQVSLTSVTSMTPLTSVTSMTSSMTPLTSVTPVTTIMTAKHTLPICATADKQKQVRVAVPIHFQAEKASYTSPVISTVTSGVAPSSSTTTDTAPAGIENLDIISTSAESKEPVLSVTSKGSISDQNRSGSTNDTASAQKDAVKIEEELSTESPEPSMEANISKAQIRRSSSSASAEQSVVVEAVNTVLTPGSFTGLLSQQTSPRVSRSSNSSPVPPDPHTSPQSKPDTTQVSSRILRSSKRKANLDESSQDGVACLDKTFKVEPIWREDFSPSSKKMMKTQALQDSESAVTLLSLQNRDPNASLVCPLVSRSKSRQTSQEQNPESPASSSSETESVARETVAEGASGDVACDAESTSGKNRGGSGGGGICSTLLAVIEQLRERSRSESDAEDKQVQPPVKKRAGRRRGRQESEEEVIEIGDNDNIEQFKTGEDSVNYRCKLCHYTNARVPLIRLHMRTHRQKDPFECSLCSMVAESSEALQEHMIQHCKVRTYACKFCPQSFNHKSTLRAHMRAHNDSEPFLCDLCEFESSNPLEYRAHMQKHTGSALLCCPLCPAVVASRQDLRIHQATNCPYSAPTPPTTTADDNNREKHDRDGNEDPVEKIFCPRCDFTSSDRARMDEHIASHTTAVGANVTGEGLLSCALCDFTAVSSRSLKSHMKRHANDQRYVQQPLEQYKCLLCGYVCHHLPSLKSHMWRHASDENYSYQFTNDVINAAIDYDTRPDPPPQPSRTSKEADEPELLDKVLAAEQRILEGQMSRPGGSEPVCWVTFRCCQCGFQTINKPKLNLHMRTHADIIQQALQVGSGSASAPLPRDDAASSAAGASDSVNIKVVYGPV